MRYFIILLTMVFTIISCTHGAKTDIPKTNVFIHGSHFDGKIWDPVINEILDQNNMVITLKGRNPTENVSLTEMATDVCSKIPNASKLIVHSFGGAVANQMAGICPEKIEKIIYITALVPIKGEKAFDSLQKADEIFYKKAVRFGKSGIEPREQKVFIKAMDAEITNKNIPLFSLYAESYAPGKDVIAYDEETFAKIPKDYIFATKDKIIGLSSQEKYATRTPMQKTLSISAGHLPMLSAPDELTQAIRQLL